MSPVFVDTSAWYALFNPTDPDHEVARHWYELCSQPLITTDFVFDELMTLLRTRAAFHKAVHAGSELLSDPTITLVRITPEDFQSAWRIFQQYEDKVWSFTDCTSRVVMDRLGVEQAFAFDDDFRQFGTVAVVP